MDILKRYSKDKKCQKIKNVKKIKDVKKKINSKGQKMFGVLSTVVEAESPVTQRQRSEPTKAFKNQH